jgi:hypothetical protein
MTPSHGPKRRRYSLELMNALTISAWMKLPVELVQVTDPEVVTGEVRIRRIVRVRRVVKQVNGISQLCGRWLTAQIARKRKSEP